MIKHLYIKNFALIDELSIDFHAGFSVITGETGAGKSIILGALSLLLGNRADTKTIKAGADKCVVEADFIVDGDRLVSFLADNDIGVSGQELTLRREISASGKSRTFANDTLVSLSLMKEIGSGLVDIHSQHQNLLLKDNNFQLSVVDTIAENGKLLSQYEENYKSYCLAKAGLEDLRKTIEQSRRNIDYIRFQYEELAAMNLKAGEEERLDKLSNAMQHAEGIKRVLYEAEDNLGDEQSGILVRLRRCINAVNGIIDVYSPAEDALQRLNNAYIDLKDLKSELAALSDDADYDPAELERVNSRLDAIYSLEKKHQAGTVEELLSLQDKFKKEIDNSDNSGMMLAELEKEMETAKEKCICIARQLGSRRRKAAERIEREMSEKLAALGLQKSEFRVSICSKELSADGTDEVDFLFSANAGVALCSVGDVASGGEIARVMLAVKAMMSGATGLPAIVFDEIDTGVSGKIAGQMAIMMKQMSLADRQVISITHLPQIAACGVSHYKVYKLQDNDKTLICMKLLSEEERVEEIAQMLSGNNVSEAAVSNAKELLGV